VQQHHLHCGSHYMSRITKLHSELLLRASVTVYPASSTSPTLQAILQPHYHKRTRSIVLKPRTMTRSCLKGALTITTVDSHNLLVAGNLSRTLRSRSLVQPRGLPLLRRFGIRGLLRPLSASSTDPSQRACLTPPSKKQAAATPSPTSTASGPRTPTPAQPQNCEEGFLCCLSPK
jgi:hypothetical protein